jgi:uncharacterized membrane protein
MAQKLLLAGILIVLLGFALLLAGSAGQGSTSVGGAVFVGPFPIVFGSGPGGSTLALVSVVIGGVMVALMLLWGWRVLRMGGD